MYGRGLARGVVPACHVFPFAHLHSPGVCSTCVCGPQHHHRHHHHHHHCRRHHHRRRHHHLQRELHDEVQTLKQQLAEARQQVDAAPVGGMGMGMGGRDDEGRRAAQLGEEVARMRAEEERWDAVQAELAEARGQAAAAATVQQQAAALRDEVDVLRPLRNTVATMQASMDRLTQRLHDAGDAKAALKVRRSVVWCGMWVWVWVNAGGGYCGWPVVVMVAHPFSSHQHTHTHTHTRTHTHTHTHATVPTPASPARRWRRVTRRCWTGASRRRTRLRACQGCRRG